MLTVIPPKKKGARPLGRLAGLSTFPFKTWQNSKWRLALAKKRGKPLLGQLPIMYVRDDRRDPRFKNTRHQRSIFNRALNRGSIRTGGCYTYGYVPSPPGPGPPASEETKCH